MINTVKDLINKLQNYDQDLKIATCLKDEDKLCGYRIFDIYDIDDPIKCKRLPYDKALYEGEIDFLPDNDKDGIDILFLEIEEV